MRCNVGVNPRYLFDQHIISEYREAVLLIGSLEYHNWQIKSPIPKRFTLGTGHMNFLKVKLKYIQRRHIEVKKEMERRNIKHDFLSIDLTNIDPYFCNDWFPIMEDSQIIRKRIIEKILNFPDLLWWRYNHVKFDNKNDILRFCDIIIKGDLFYV
jgi:deoxyribonuclease (pyrimidine dimer)